jgi:hypothetical protein
MQNHPGDTLGKRFLTWWGSVLAILAFGVCLWLVRKTFGPNATDPLDGGMAQARLEKRRLVEADQRTELSKYEIDKAKGTVRMPPAELVSYAASVLSQQKAKSGPPVPGAVPPAAPAPAAPPVAK